jgi:hypothetical protein
MRFTTIAVLLLAASVAHAKPGNGNGRGNDKRESIREEAKELKEIAQDLRKGANGLVKGQDEIAKEQASLRGNKKPVPAESMPAEIDCKHVVIHMQNHEPKPLPIPKDKCPEVWHRFHQLQDKQVREAFKDYHPVRIEHAKDGMPIEPKKPRPGDADYERKMKDYPAAMREYKKQDVKFEVDYFKNKYHPQANKGNGGRGNGKKG